MLTVKVENRPDLEEILAMPCVKTRLEKVDRTRKKAVKWLSKERKKSQPKRREETNLI